MSRSGVAGSWGSLIFEEPSSRFPYWVHQFTFPPTVFTYFFFSTSLPTFICVLDDCYFGRCEGVTSVGVDLHFFEDYRCKALFPVPVCHLYHFFGKKCLLRPLPFSKWSWFFCLLFNWMNGLYILDISPLTKHMNCKYFLLFHFISLSFFFCLPLL